MGNITGALIENAFQPQNDPDSPLDMQEEIKKITRDSSNRELYRLLHAKMEQSAFDRGTPSHAATLNSEGDCDGSGGATKKWESVRRPSAEEQSSARCSSTSSGGWGGGTQCAENVPFSSECSSRSVDGKSGGLTSSKPTGDQDGGREVPQMAFKKKLLKSYCIENEDSTAKTDPSAVPQGEKDGGKKDEVGPEVNVKDASNVVECRSSSASELKTELFSDTDVKPRSKLMNINTCIEVIVMNELKKLDSVSEDLPSGKQMPLFAIIDSSKNRPCESRGNDLVRVNTGNNRSSVEPGWLSRNESGSRATDAEPKREKWPQYVNVDAAPGRVASSEFSPQQLLSRKTDIGTQGGSTRSVPSAYRGSGYPPEANLVQDMPRIYTSSSSDNAVRNARLTNQFGDSGVEVPISHGPVVKYSPSSAWGRDISPAQSSPHVMMQGDSGFKVMPSGQVPSMSMLDPRRKQEREPEPTKYQQTEYLPYVSQQQYHSVSSLPEQHSAYQICPPVLQEKLHASDAAPYGYPAKNSRERVHGGQFDSSYGSHPDSLQPPVANYIKHSPKNSPILAYERDGARPLGPEAQYHRSDQPQYHRSDQPQHHRSDQPQYHRSDLLKSQPGSLMTGSARSYRMVADQQPPPPQVCYRNERQARAELQMDKKGFPYQSIPEEYVERRIKRTSSNSREMGNVSAGPDQPVPRSFSISYPPRVREGMEKVHSGHSEETPLDLTVKKEFSDAHHSSMYLLPSGVKQQQTDWGVARGVGYRPSYAGSEEDPLNARLMNRPAPQKGPDFAVPEMQRREALDVRNLYDKVPSGLQVLPPESEIGRPTPVNERNMPLRTSVIASHPFEDSPASLAPNLHRTMQHLSEALTKTSMHPIGAWKQSPYGEMVPRSRAHTLDTESSSRLMIDATSRQERPRPRPNNSSSNDLLHLATTSPTIPHLSPVQPLVSTASSQVPGSRRAPGPSLLGSHSPSDILHLQCKVCGSTYGSLRSFRMHFAKVHGLEPLPEHCNISTISGTKNAMSKVPIEDSEPPALQRETMPTDVASMGKNRSGFDSFGSTARPTKPDILRVEPAPANTRTKQVAEVYPMPARASRGLSPQLKVDAEGALAWQSEFTDSHVEQNDGQTKLGGDVKNSSRLVNCDLGIFRSRNCYSDLGCDRDTDCPECLDGFKDISDWKMHISTHMMRSCMCKACNLSFTHSGALKKHLHGVHSHVEKVEVEYRCLFCREAFSDEKVLFYHTQEHEKRYSRLEGSRRDSVSSLSFKAPGGTVDSDCIQMAVPDTTCSDDVRPTSDFGGENSSNVSPSSFPGAESKGSGGYESKLANDPTSCQVSLDSETVGRKTEDSTDDDKKPKTGELELSYKHRTMLQALDSSSDLSHSSEQSRLDAASQLLHRSHGIQYGPKVEDRETSAEGKPEAKFSFEIGEECRHFKPTTTPKAVEETSTFVWKKQAVLKRVQSGENRDSTETDSNAPVDKLSPVSSRAASVSRSSGGASAEKSSEVSQPIHLRDLFSMMGHQVEKSIWGIPDFPQFNSVPTTRGSRCVRDVCDEIIALSFREESSPREPVPGSSMPDKLDVNAKTKVTEQLKSLVNPDHEIRPELPDVRTNTESLYGGWTRSPCSSHDSCHSLEIDESGFNRDSAEGDSVRLESTDSEPRSLYGEPVVGSTSPRQEYGRKESTETAEDGKYPGEGDAKIPYGSRSHRGCDDEGTVRHSEAFYGRRPSSEGPPSDAAATNRTKDGGSPSSSKQETSTEGNDGSSYLSTQVISSDSVPMVGSKRKHLSDCSKETADVDDEPPEKKSVPC